MLGQGLIQTNLVSAACIWNDLSAFKKNKRQPLNLQRIGSALEVGFGDVKIWSQIDMESAFIEVRIDLPQLMRHLFHLWMDGTRGGGTSCDAGLCLPGLCSRYHSAEMFLPSRTVQVPWAESPIESEESKQLRYSKHSKHCWGWIPANLLSQLVVDHHSVKATDMMPSVVLFQVLVRESLLEGGVTVAWRILQWQGESFELITIHPQNWRIVLHGMATYDHLFKWNQIDKNTQVQASPWARSNTSLFGPLFPAPCFHSSLCAGETCLKLHKWREILIDFAASSTERNFLHLDPCFRCAWVLDLLLLGHSQLEHLCVNSWRVPCTSSRARHLSIVHCSDVNHSFGQLGSGELLLCGPYSKSAVPKHRRTDVSLPCETMGCHMLQPLAEIHWSPRAPVDGDGGVSQAPSTGDATWFLWPQDSAWRIWRSFALRFCYSLACFTAPSILVQEQKCLLLCRAMYLYLLQGQAVQVPESDLECMLGGSPHEREFPWGP